MTKILIIFLGLLFLSCSDKNEYEDKDLSQRTEVELENRKSIHQEEWEEHNKNENMAEASFSNFDVIIENTKSIT